jgi:hypothetical protein
MDITHNEHCHVVKHKETGDSGMNKKGKSSDTSSRSSEQNSEGRSYGGASNKASDRDRTKSVHGRSLDSTGTEKQLARKPPLCLNTKKCAGEKHYLSDCPHTRRDESVVLLSEYKWKRDAYKKKANFNTLGNCSACYALLRMRPLSISFAECSVVISCGNVDYDKSG